MALDDADGGLDHGVVLVEILHEGLLVEHVVDDAAADEAVEQVVGATDHEVAPRQAVVGAEGGKLIDEALALQIVGQVDDLGERAQVGAVGVGVVEGKLEDQSAHDGLLVVGGDVGRVLGHEDVGRDAATAIDGASERGVVGGTRMVDAVAGEELAPLVALEEVLVVVGLVAELVGLLYAAARGRVVAGDGEADLAAVGESDLLLHEALAEGSAADDGAAVVVLDGTGEDLGRGGRGLVDEDDQRDGLIGAAPAAAVVAAGTLAALRIDDETVLGQKLVGHLYGALKVAAVVVAQIDDEAREALLRKRGQRGQHLHVGLLSEGLDADVARAVVEHVGGGDARRDDVGAGDGEALHGFRAIAHHAHLHLRALGAHQAAARLGIGDDLANEGLAIDLDDLVAGQQAHLLGRTALDDVAHVDGVALDGKLDAHAGERALELAVDLLHVLGGDVGGVGVELGKDLGDGLVHEVVDIDRIDILVVDDAQQVVEAVAAVVDDAEAVAREVVGVERADKDAENDAHGHEQGGKPVGFFL